MRQFRPVPSLCAGWGVMDANRKSAVLAGGSHGSVLIALAFDTAIEC